MEDNENSIYALKTSAGQERNVARILATRSRDTRGTETFIGIETIIVFIVAILFMSILSYAFLNLFIK